jgi:hypothetical protein
MNSDSDGFAGAVLGAVLEDAAADDDPPDTVDDGFDTVDLRADDTEAADDDPVDEPAALCPPRPDDD